MAFSISVSHSHIVWTTTAKEKTQREKKKITISNREGKKSLVLLFQLCDPEIWSRSTNVKDDVSYHEAKFETSYLPMSKQKIHDSINYALIFRDTQNFKKSTLCWTYLIYALNNQFQLNQIRFYSKDTMQHKKSMNTKQQQKKGGRNVEGRRGRRSRSRELFGGGDGKQKSWGRRRADQEGDRVWKAIRQTS